MKVLILDDNPIRLSLFRSKLIGHTVFTTMTSEEAIDALKSDDFDIVSLDHDLGGEQMVDSGKGTGYEVAEFLSKNPDRMPKEIYIHSYNPVGAKNMQRILPGSILAPGNWKS